MTDDIRNQAEEDYRQAAAGGELPATKFACDLCGERRLADDIDVLVKPIFYKGQKIGTQNIRFCASRDECRVKAKNFYHVKPEGNWSHADED